jgi:polyhydroxyalkanoate synthesis regulator phasin
MAEKVQGSAVKPATNAVPAAAVVKRGPGHRAVDARDAIAELTERAQEISLEAGSKVSAAMKDVISAAVGLAGFAVESARDLVQYMVRRGQMTPEEGDKLLREAEVAHAKRPASERKRPTASEVQAKTRAVQRAEAAAAREAALSQHIMRAAAKRTAGVPAPMPKKAAASKPAAVKAAKPAKSAKSKPTKSAKPAKRAAKKR